MCLYKVQQRAMVKGFNKLSYETKSKKLNIYSLDKDYEDYAAT